MDIDGQLIEFLDTFAVNFEIEHDKTVWSQYHEKQRKASMTGKDINIGSIIDVDMNPGRAGHKRLHSMGVIPNINLNAAADDEKDTNHAGNKSRDEQLVIEVPIYNTKIGDGLEHYDFSINTAIIDFASVLSLNGSVDIDQWKEIISNGAPHECDAIKDITQNKILKFPEDEGEEHVIAIHPVGFHFWRIIKWMISHPYFKLDDKLIQVHKKHYNQWLNLSYFSSTINILSFLKHFMDILQNQCKSFNDVEQMLYIMDLLSFHDQFIPLIQKSVNLKSEFISSIYKVTNNSFKPKQVINLFENEYKYPSLQRDFDNASLERENKLLLQEIKILERENSVLQRENKLHQTQARVGSASGSSVDNVLETRVNDLENKFEARLHDLEGDNKELKKENETLKDQNRYLQLQINNATQAKKQMVINSDNCIQELREIIKKYQNGHY